MTENIYNIYIFLITANDFTSNDFEISENFFI